MGKHGGVLICGYCKKQTPLDDDLLVDLVEGVQEMSAIMPICTCGHFSFVSSIRFKADINPKDWRMSVGYST